MGERKTEDKIHESEAEDCCGASNQSILAGEAIDAVCQREFEEMAGVEEEDRAPP